MLQFTRTISFVFSILLLLGFADLSIDQAMAQVEQKTILLWEAGAPGANGQEVKDKPSAILYLLPKSSQSHPLLVVYPGGGYGGLAMDHEGHQIARWANELGMSALICDYRHRGKGYGHPAPLQDALRAIRLARFHADDWGIHPEKIGIMGFSAGGHLASTVLTHFDAGDASSSDPIATKNSRPNFGILCYPVICFGQSATHMGSQKNLLGENPSDELIESLSNEKQVKPDTPPTFLFHTQEDKAVVPENSLRFYNAMLEKGVAGELHLFSKGPHGVGLAKSLEGTNAWPELCANWLRGIGILSKKN